MSNIDATLAERGSRYGSFESHARITQSLKDAMRATPNWEKLAPDQKEALEMNAHKIGRILNGDPNFHDSWHDIVGYMKLVADRLAPKALVCMNCDKPIEHLHPRNGAAVCAECF